MKRILLCVIILVISANCAQYWTWKCINSACVKRRLDDNQEAISPKICWLTCDKYANIWPMPTGTFKTDGIITTIRLSKIYVINLCSNSNVTSSDLDKIVERFFDVVSKYNNHKIVSNGDKESNIEFELDNVDPMKVSLNNDESYVLMISQKDGEVPLIKIKASCLIGARHALETLSQVLIYDQNQHNYVVPHFLYVEDIPTYPIRGLLLDTARNFISVRTIKRILEGMAVDKLNNFHWHLTDTQSFPYQSTLLPQLSDIGAYSADKVYTPKDVRDIMEFARIRGIRVLPEFDGPAHVGEGWQRLNYVRCFAKEPWNAYCKEPPCGQFDPTLDKLYSTLQLLFRDMIDAFDPDLFHFGGDEVLFKCWRDDKNIKAWMRERNITTFFDSGYVKLWSYYQNRVYDIFMRERKYNISAILWTSTLTDSGNINVLSNDKYIIQVWTTIRDATIKRLLENNFRVIFSNYDSLYLDCGFQNWMGSGNNWCGPYIGWQKMYTYSPAGIVSNLGENANKPHLIMGAEAALWTETVDDTSAEARIWPRVSALSERLWAEPKSTWQNAVIRLDAQRERLTKLGIRVESVQPQWCQINQRGCSWKKYSSASSTSTTLLQKVLSFTNPQKIFTKP